MAKRFEREKKMPYTVPEGTFERATILFVKETFLQETTGVSDTSFWCEIEDRAVEFTPDQTCFQFYLEGTGHVTLAERLIKGFQTTRGMSVTEKDRENLVNRLSKTIY